MPNILVVTWHAPFPENFSATTRLSKDEAMYQIWSP